MMKCQILTLSLLVFLGAVHYAYCCSCMPMHPQEHYCRSDFVILARVKKEQEIPATKSRVYKVRVKKEFKMTEKALVALKSGRIHTPLEDSVCGVMLSPGGLYVLSGSIQSLKAHIVLCDMFLNWHRVTKRQKKGLRLLYKQGCNCGISKCYYNCNRQKDICAWKGNCEFSQGVCTRQRNGYCHWIRSKELTNCRFPNRNTTLPLWQSNNIL